MNTELLLIVMEIEIFAILVIMIYHLLAHKKAKTKQKPDSLLKHFKEYLVEGYTVGQAKQKLKKIGFDKERIDKIMTDFLRH